MEIEKKPSKYMSRSVAELNISVQKDITTLEKEQNQEKVKMDEIKNVNMNIIM